MRRRFCGISSRMGEMTILIGCCETPVIEAVKVLLAGRHITERSRMDEFVSEASTGEYDAVVFCPNSIAPPLLLKGSLLENAKVAVKSIKGVRKVPLVVLSTMPEWRDPLLAAGADAFLSLPVNVTEFREAVEGRFTAEDESALCRLVNQVSDATRLDVLIHRRLGVQMGCVLDEAFESTAFVEAALLHLVQRFGYSESLAHTGHD